MFTFKRFQFLSDAEINLVLEGTTQENKTLGYLPSYKFYITLHNKPDTIIGKIDIRIGHNENSYYGGNIGYEIYEKYRGHHYASKACQLIKQVAMQHDMDRLYITCNPDNIASQKTCMHAGLTFINIIDVPPHIDLYKYGDKKKYLYEWILHSH